MWGHMHVGICVMFQDWSPWTPKPLPVYSSEHQTPLSNDCLKSSSAACMSRGTLCVTPPLLPLLVLVLWVPPSVSTSLWCMVGTGCGPHRDPSGRLKSPSALHVLPPPLNTQSEEFPQPELREAVGLKRLAEKIVLTSVSVKRVPVFTWVGTETDQGRLWGIWWFPFVFPELQRGHA